MYVIKEVYGMCFYSHIIRKVYEGAFLVKEGEFIGFRLGGVLYDKDRK